MKKNLLSSVLGATLLALFFACPIPAVRAADTPPAADGTGIAADTGGSATVSADAPGTQTPKKKKKHRHKKKKAAAAESSAASPAPSTAAGQ